MHNGAASEEGTWAPERLLSEDEELIWTTCCTWLTLVRPLLTVAVVVGVGAAWVVMPAGDLQQPARLPPAPRPVVLLATAAGRVLGWATTHLWPPPTADLSALGWWPSSAARSPWSASTTSPSPSRCSSASWAGDLLLESAGSTASPASHPSATPRPSS